MNKSKIISEVDFFGFSFIKEINSITSTLDFAQSIGTIYNIENDFLNIKNIQELTPKNESESSSSRYSGVYGMSAFPFHTDLAHFIHPPRYIILRCIKGHPEVHTELLHTSYFENKLGKKNLNFSLVKSRKNQPKKPAYLMPLRFNHNDIHAFRWDTLFLEPVNEYAKKSYENFIDTDWSNNKISICLTNYNDVLIIDNWKMLHSRTSAPESAKNRKIERIYLDFIG